MNYRKDHVHNRENFVKTKSAKQNSKPFKLHSLGPVAEDNTYISLEHGEGELVPN